jgi:hypothetical protein
VSDSAAIVLEVVAGPDGGVGLVERELGAVAAGEGAAEEALLPCEVALEGGPDFVGEVEVAGPAKMAEEHVEEDHVHVVVVVRQVSLGVEQGLFVGEVGFGIGGAGGRGRCGNWRDILLFQPAAEVQFCTVVVAERVERVGAAPAGEH